MENLGYCGYCPCRFMTARCLSESVSEQKGGGSWTRSLLSSPKEKRHLCPSAAWNQYSTTGGKWYMGHFPANYECNVKHKQFIFSSEIRTRGRMFFYTSLWTAYLISSPDIRVPTGDRPMCPVPPVWVCGAWKEPHGSQSAEVKFWSTSRPWSPREPLSFWGAQEINVLVPFEKRLDGDK